MKKGDFIPGFDFHGHLSVFFFFLFGKLSKIPVTAID